MLEFYACFRRDALPDKISLNLYQFIYYVIGNKCQKCKVHATFDSANVLKIVIFTSIVRRRI